MKNHQKIYTKINTSKILSIRVAIQQHKSTNKRSQSIAKYKRMG